MANCFISSTNWLESAATPTCTDSAAADLPLANLKDGAGAPPARILDTAFTLSWDLGSARSIRVIAIPRHSLTTGATYRLKLGTTAGAGDVLDTGGSLLSLGVVEGHDTAAIVLSAAYSARYGSLEISDTGNAETYVDLGELWIGAADIAPAVGFDYGAAYGPKFADETARAEDGTPWGFQRRSLRSWRLTFNWLTDAEANQLLDLQRIKTGVLPVVVVPDVTHWTDPGRRVLVALLAGGQPLTVGRGRRNAMTLEATEI